MNPVRLKVCGITDPDQGRVIALMGADALGFILAPRSPRYVAPEELPRLLAGLPPLVKTVGVFVDRPKQEVLEIAKTYGLDLVQLHGQESPADCRWLTQRGQAWIKAIRVGGAQDLEGLEGYGPGPFLLDTKNDKAQGGTGETFDWSLARAFCRNRLVLLAGGLKPGNLQAAVQTVRPYGVDLNSGLETAPGVKDLEQVAQAIKILRNR
ncbi:MAG: hypothetical protein A2600_01690 [Candidatus Lambdaproteobacteria bacterium RIFOXYD1_FULL_56_27]|uniref:N-(5'-phosphoribosyl)anthranilate isomerase n=1 Tax=Candidatus Lambdaproteobacteria bacterium RIFOXYD2_FULL_56_26 TaxID=1817773 RepID=A0A1F6GN00_9PROT|nr:MAG: hypothetical protein A2557_12740 [Candidatus Lambdaproteobacteria bacterium RIFOXYD2_FULL_56_26]OGH05557.1 MAG: hypothetical protein A2426_04480 [Candidatus Lambdaproteobacteria bacterium RIFOXYC1_FULL_56_13]OGH08516.1 MAG: hypothetical protein A2600_01690 [Candidatus Lambdaproteobacteria bacterium RIFOXYD1_FULL_56_27]